MKLLKLVDANSVYLSRIDGTSQMGFELGQNRFRIGARREGYIVVNPVCTCLRVLPKGNRQLVGLGRVWHDEINSQLRIGR